jgi:P27 family predicted phage terminase small subunit
MPVKILKTFFSLRPFASQKLTQSKSLPKSRRFEKRMAGRKSIPINTHRLKGTYRKDRHGAASRVEAAHGVPECPGWLSDRAKAAWAHFAPLLDERRVLTVADGSALTVLCQVFAEWQQLSEDLETEGLTYEAVTASGAMMRRPNPKVPMRADANRRLNASLAEFGLSPGTRVKIAPVPGVSETDMNVFQRIAVEGHRIRMADEQRRNH